MKGWESMIQDKTINTIRILSAEAVQAANSGHPGLPLGAAPMAFTLWSEVLKHNPKNPNWHNRDRFVLSAGHGSMLLYSLLHLFEYGLTMDEIKNFRQLNSLTPGHPEYGHTVGVETSTGPLGQGISNAVGFAIAEAHLAAKFNTAEHKIVDHHTYVIHGDGCLMEGISYEAASLAGTLKLGKLIMLYDSNSISIEGSTDLAFTEDVAGRFTAMHWQVIEVEDGNDTKAIASALATAKTETEKPSLIIVKTIIGYGCTSKQGSHKVHGSPLGAEGIKELKAFANWESEESFYVPQDVRDYMHEKVTSLADAEKEWQITFKDYQEKYPQLAKEYQEWQDKKIPMDYLDSDEFWQYNEAVASRSSSGKVLNALADKVPNLFGGSADLAPSNNSEMKNREDFFPTHYEGSNMHFGVRELAMAGITNGIQLHGGLRAYAATFFVFSDYMKPSIRLASLMKLPVTYILTHDSIGVGEDGPTHQPIEQLAMLRAVPNLNVIRPADAKEVSAAWYMAMTSTETPSVLVLSRQNLTELEGSSKEALKGGYIVSKEKDAAQIIFIATGSEVELAVKTQKLLWDEGVDSRVVSMPCMRVFDGQSHDYKAMIIPKEIPTISIEAASTFGWAKYAHVSIGHDDFGLSAPASDLYNAFGITVENILKTAKSLV